jgi:hypothetical protein
MAKWSNHFISFLANSFKKGQIATLPNPSLTGITKLRDIYTLPLSLVVFLLLSLPLFLLPIRIKLQTGRCCALPLSSHLRAMETRLESDRLLGCGQERARPRSLAPSLTYT